MKSRKETIFAVVAPGLEAVCAGELAHLGIDGRMVPGGVEFEGGLEALYRANLWLRTAGRLLVRLGSMKARDFPDLFNKAKRLPWGKFIRPGTPLEVRAASHRSRLMHSGRLAETIAAAAAQALGSGTAATEGIAQRVLVRLEDDRCQISIDSSGERLHRRGYRQSVTRAPLRETLAAGVLLLLGWDGSVPLLDPMCGSGTFRYRRGALGAAVAARRTAAFCLHGLAGISSGFVAGDYGNGTAASAADRSGDYWYRPGCRGGGGSPRQCRSGGGIVGPGAAE